MKTEKKMGEKGKHRKTGHKGRESSGNRREHRKTEENIEKQGKTCTGGVLGKQEKT